MRIALDGIPLSEPRTGVGHYTFELALALARKTGLDEIQLVSPRPFAHSPETPEPGDIPSNFSSKFVATNIMRRRWFALGLPRYLSQHRIDLFHGTNYEIPFRRVRPSVLTIHDLSLLLFPDTHVSRRVWRSRLRLPLMVRAATMIITPTEVIRHEVCKHLGVSGENVVAIPEAPRAVFRPADPLETRDVLGRLGITGEFFLAVGTLEPRKNLKALAAGFSELLRSTTHRPQLVIVGKEGWLHEEFELKIRGEGVARLVNLTGYLPDSDLRALYSSCTAFVFPSIYEGFGLPPLEALACGATVIANRIPSQVEVLGNAAVLVDMSDVRQLRDALAHLLDSENRSANRGAIGLSHASRFTWERTADLTRAVYQKATERFYGPGKL
jgi:glycosyltransferase involved in cell wall biosynthesis